MKTQAPGFDERPKIIHRAGNCETAARFLTLIAILIAGIGAVCFVSGEVSPENLHAHYYISGGFFLWAFFCNILAQLLFIRAELSRKL